ncbi:MAG: thioesterase family protein [Desulfohalobiaceae bacterium]|nr:thioesterase family protein [Desulfohalobiaceae bacterium]
MTETHPLAPGLIGQAEARVTENDLAPHVGSGDVSVYATPRLAALMEKAAIDSIQGLLNKDQTTVGARLDLSHLAPTPAGARVRAEARLEGVDSKKLRFSITAFDEGEKIGEAHHERIIVSREKFLARAEEKKGT